jgi:hypothetical protein
MGSPLADIHGFAIAASTEGHDAHVRTRSAGSDRSLENARLRCDANASRTPGERGLSRYRVDVTAKPSSLTGSVAVMERRRLGAHESTLGRLDIDELGCLK